MLIPSHSLLYQPIFVSIDVLISLYRNRGKIPNLCAKLLFPVMPLIPAAAAGSLIPPFSTPVGILHDFDSTGAFPRENRSHFHLKAEDTST